jgi:hypothetical protein
MPIEETDDMFPGGVRTLEGAPAQALTIYKTVTDAVLGILLIPPIQLSSTVTASTTSAAYVVLSSMTFTIALAGNYLADFSTYGAVSAGGALAEVALHVNGVIVSHTLRGINGTQLNHLGTQAYLTGLLVGNVVDVRFRTSLGTFSIHHRSLILHKTA